MQFSAEDVGIADAVARAVATDVDAGLRLRLATVPDLVVLKLATAGEATRRPSKRSQDCTDVLKLLEEHPEVRTIIPDLQEQVLQLVVQIVRATIAVDVEPGEE